MRIPGAVLYAVAHLPGLLYPMAGRVQVLPLAAGVILQVVKCVVLFALDRYVLGKRIFIR